MKSTPVKSLVISTAFCLVCCSKSNNRESASSASVEEHSKHVALAEHSRETLTSDILEAVFRYQFDHGDPNIPRTPRGSRYKAYYLGVVNNDFSITGNGIPSDEDIKDPEDALIERLRGISPMAKRFSQCKKTISRVTDNGTGLPGVLLVVGEVRWKSKTEVEVEAGYYFQSFWAAGQLFHLEWAGDRFLVTTVDQPWTS